MTISSSHCNAGFAISTTKVIYVQSELSVCSSVIFCSFAWRAIVRSRAWFLPHLFCDSEGMKSPSRRHQWSSLCCTNTFCWIEENRFPSFSISYSERMSVSSKKGDRLMWGPWLRRPAADVGFDQTQGSVAGRWRWFKAGSRRRERIAKTLARTAFLAYCSKPTNGKRNNNRYPTFYEILRRITIGLNQTASGGAACCCGCSQ